VVDELEGSRNSKIGGEKPLFQLLERFLIEASNQHAHIGECQIHCAPPQGFFLFRSVSE